MILVFNKTVQYRLINLHRGFFQPEIIVLFLSWEKKFGGGLSSRLIKTNQSFCDLIFSHEISLTYMVI